MARAREEQWKQSQRQEVLLRFRNLFCLYRGIKLWLRTHPTVVSEALLNMRERCDETLRRGEREKAWKMRAGLLSMLDRLGNSGAEMRSFMEFLTTGRGEIRRDEFLAALATFTAFAG
mmetsp:Transcript_56683/g.117047  ORF Transcript_56683/g.117047 Transcript_56683/m.117047 type:complete len:118 (-) Transcript_56683:150-503(-)